MFEGTDSNESQKFFLKNFLQILQDVEFSYMHPAVITETLI